MSVSDEEVLPLCNLKKKESVDDVVVNPDLTTEQQTEIKKFLD